MRLTRKEKKYKRQLRRRTFIEYASGRLDRDNAAVVMSVINSPVALRKLIFKLEHNVNPWAKKGFSGFDWKEFFLNVWDWIKENWDDILMIILKLAPLLLLQPQYAELPRR